MHHVIISTYASKQFSLSNSTLFFCCFTQVDYALQISQALFCVKTGTPNSLNYIKLFSYFPW